MIFLSILKIFGIVLACIVGIILIIALMLLFLPFSYKIVAKGHNTNTNIIFSSKWLFGIINLKFSYVEGKVDFFTKVIGINLLDIDKNNDKKIDKKENSRKETLAKNNKSNSEVKIKVKQKKKPKKRLTLKEFFIKQLNKIKNFFIRLKNIKVFATSDITKRAVKKIKLIIVKMLKSIFPKKIKGNLTYGIYDPGTTAITYGLLANWAEQRKQDDLIITPDFEENGVFLDLKINGRLFLGYMLICFLQLFFNKDIKKMFNAIRRISNGR